MKRIIQLISIITILLSMAIISGCGEQKDKFVGTWVGSYKDASMYRLTIQENGNDYLITEDIFVYQAEKDMPRPYGYGLFSNPTNNPAQPNGTYNINYVLKENSSRHITASKMYDRENKLLEDQLRYDKGRFVLYYIDKDGSLLLDGVRLKKETSPDAASTILKQLQLTMRQELESKYHKYGARSLGTLHEKIILGNITFDDSILTAK